MTGLFITIEGMDGSGKTTQINLLKNHFENKGQEVVLSREPGGTLISEKIRHIILDTDHKEMVDMTEALLYAASRAQHVAEKIQPAIQAGKIVICDRFVDSSIAYQGYARGLGMDVVAGINQYATGGLTPDLTFFLDVSPESGMERKKEHKVLDRLEAEKKEFHQRVRKGYHKLLDQDPQRLVAIPADGPIEAIHQTIIQALDKRLKT